MQHQLRLMANTCAIEAERWADYEKAIDDALLIPARFLSAKYYQKTLPPPPDMSEETEPEYPAFTPNGYPTQGRLL